MTRVEVLEDRKAFDPERLRCSAIIAASLGTCQISVHRKEQYNRAYPKLGQQVRTQSKRAVSTKFKSKQSLDLQST